MVDIDYIIQACNVSESLQEATYRVSQIHAHTWVAVMAKLIGANKSRD